MLATNIPLITRHIMYNTELGYTYVCMGYICVYAASPFAKCVSTSLIEREDKLLFALLLKYRVTYSYRKGVVIVCKVT